MDATPLIGSANVAHLGIVGKENIFFLHILLITLR